MNLHANAALSLKGRRELCRRVVEADWKLTEAAAAASVSVRCARKWVTRYRSEGEIGLLDRSSAPGAIAHRTSEQRVEAIAALRRLRFTGPEIAETLADTPNVHAYEDLQTSRIIKARVVSQARGIIGWWPFSHSKRFVLSWRRRRRRRSS
jgi:transposase